ncbi:MAG: RNase adapter RapZ [Candidatus Calescibacterium sp.]|nr:RNase adapter RapZ [Candidatus Calescibacterium sp.]MCX7733497.1 RNase adapter RapZ [bacterium]MDW8087210.1 RNase adapter RapZ [Candidatus Calescibacterium sp.]
MKVIFITGISGSGKTTALKTLEDLGYYTVDNIPIDLIHEVISLTKRAGIELITFGVSPRDNEMVKKFLDVLETLRKEKEYEVRLIFLDAKDDAIIRRYKETRRKHPFEEGKTIDKAIKIERELLLPIADYSDYRIDTTEINIHQLRQRIREVAGIEKESIVFHILSFGFKYGIPSEADLVFDVRFVRNPNFHPELKKLDGTNKEVQDYVFSDENAVKYLRMIEEMVEFLKDRLVKDGRYTATIAIGCTGGRHRSIAFAEKLKEFIENKVGAQCIVNHRDKEKDLLI